MKGQQGKNEHASPKSARVVWLGIVCLAAAALADVGALVVIVASSISAGPLANLGIFWRQSPLLGALILVIAALMLVGLWVLIVRLFLSSRPRETAQPVADAKTAGIAADADDTTSAAPLLVSELVSHARLLSDRPPSDQENPTEADRLRFGQFVDVLAGVIRESATNSPFTISIEAEWGTGKTTAMRMLQHVLDTAPLDTSEWTYRTVWFDAWTYRRTEIQKGFLSTIFQALKQDTDAGTPPLAFATAIVRETAKKDLTALLSDVAGRVTRGGDIGTHIAEKLDTELRYRNQFRYDFRKILELWAKLKGAKRLLLVIFIDEMDRCAPDETVRVLEMMKLFFDTPGCIFVLAYDVDLVAECVRHAYRPVITDGMSYLKKLIQVSYPLPTPSDEALSAFIRASIQDAHLTAFFEEVRRWIADQPGAREREATPEAPDYVPFIMRGTHRSPREIKRFLNALVVSTPVVAAQLNAPRDRQIYMTLCILLLLQIRWPHFREVLVGAPEIVADIYAYLDARFGAPPSPNTPAEVQPITLMRVGERLPWLRNDEELCRFLWDYPLRGQTDHIRRLVTIGLPAMEETETTAEAPESISQANTNALFELSLLPTPEHFIGRTRDLAWLLEHLRAGGVASIAGIHGMGGIGKTSLAAVAARQLYAQGRFAGGIAVVSCQGKTEALEVLYTVLSRFASEYPLPDASDEAGLVDAAHRLLEGKDILVVLDNIEPELQITRVVEPLRDAGVTLLLTSRQILPFGTVPPEAALTLDMLPREEALELFAQAYGRHQAAEMTAAEQTAAAKIVEALGCHTLAVRLAGAYAANMKRDLATLASELADPHRAMDLPRDEISRALALSFHESTDQLPREAQRLFMALTAFATLNVGRNAALTLARELHLSDDCVDLLVRRALVDAVANEGLPKQTDRERLRLHPLVCAFAEELAAQQPEHEQEAARRIICDYYARYVGGVPAVALAADELNIEGALRWAHAYGMRKNVVDLCIGMRTFWYGRSNTKAGTEFLPWGIAAGTELAVQSDAREDRLRVADLQLTAAQFLRYQGKLGEVEEALKQNLDVRLKLVDRRGEGAVRSQLGQIARIRGDLKIAENDFGQSLAIRREVGDREGEAYDLSQLGHIFKTRGYLEEAEARFEQSLEIRQAIGDRRGEGTTLGYIGRVYQAKGNPQEAERYFNESLRIAREQHDARGEAGVRSSLGQLELARGQFARAESYLRESLAMHRSINDRQGEAGDLSQFGRLALDRELLKKAESYFQSSLAINREGQNIPDEGVNLSQLGLVAIEQQQLDIGKSYLQQSLAIRHKISDPRGEGVDLALLGRIAFEEGDLDAAQQYFTDSIGHARTVQNKRGEGVNLRYLAAIAAQRDDDEGAERLYREALQIANEVQNGLDIAAAQLGLGRFLIERRQNSTEGCRLIQQAVQQYHEWHLPRAKPARELAARLGCELSVAEGVAPETGAGVE